MGEKGRISLWQFFLLVTGFLIGTSTLIIPVGPAKQDAWISFLLAGTLGLGAAYCYTALGRRFPRESPLQYASRVLGRWPGTCFNIIFLWYALHLAALVLRNVVDLYKLIVLPQTPVEVVAGVFAGLAAYAVRLGIEAPARLGELLTPFIIVAILVLTALAVSVPGLVHWEALFPVMERGPLPVLRGVYPTFVYPFGETVFFLVLLPFLTEPRKSFAPFARAVIIVTLLTTLVLVRNLIVLGASETARMNYPSLIAIQMINIGVFLQRLEPVIIFVWSFTILLKLIVVYYTFTLGTAQLLGLRDYRPLVLPAGVLLTFLSLSLYDNFSQMLTFAGRVYPFYFLPAYLIYPVTLLLVAKIRKIKG
ncbi:spore germination protein YndE [Moorella thermoacetica]|uniref:Spore germination protein YndE n=1 Tax=Neomoorella thermoacetica TaxID=1525 RepID=A0A1J5NT19_NEOTH|nr:spore germination protein YndE [Moorella thermoacetica]